MSLDIKHGEFVVFVGPSGCGKSTALRMIAGLESITEGALSIDGEVVNHVDPRKRGIAMVFQSYALYPNLTVRKNIESPLNAKDVPPEIVSSPAIMRSAVLLPQPDGPTSTRNSPSATSSVSPNTACCPLS